MILKIKRETPEIDIPEYESLGASGFDLKAHLGNSIFVEPRDLAIVPTGLSFEVPSGYEMQIRSRSGLAIKHSVMVLNSPGTIDSDYRGEVKVILINLGHSTFRVRPGARIAQGVIAAVQQVDLLEIQEDLTETIRGSQGFGSTGV